MMIRGLPCLTTPPIAKFSVAVKGYTLDDDDLFCVNLKVNFMKFLNFDW
jgi:hypothetical protein